MVSLQPYWSLQDVMKLALKIERQVKEKGVATTRYSAKGDSSRGIKTQSATLETSSKQ